MWKKIRMAMLFTLLVAAVLTGVLARRAWVRFGTQPGAEDVARFENSENFKNGRFVNLEPALQPIDEKKIPLFKGLTRFIFGSENAPKEEVPQVRLSRGSFAQKPAEFSMRWLGHSMMIFEMGGARFITDPVFGNAAPLPFAVRRYCPPPISRKELPHLDFVLVSHDHYDHLEYESVRHFAALGTKFITALGVGARLRGWGVKPENITELDWHESAEICGVKITVLPARHFSGRSLADRDKTLWASYLFEGGGKKIFFGADGGYGRHFRHIGLNYGPFDVACLEIDAWNEMWPNNHLFPEDVARAFKDLKARRLLPIHWGVFDLAMHPYNESVEKIRALAQRENIELLSPLMGEEFSE